MPLTCLEAQQTSRWLLDDEIDSVEMPELQAHLDACPDCRNFLEHQSTLRKTIKRSGEAIVAPPALRQRIRTALNNERRRNHPVFQYWPAAAAAAILLAFIWRGGGLSATLSELDEAAERHARDLPLDVVAADAGQLQRYFAGKLPFAVPVPQFAPKELPVRLLGGRVTELHNRQAAYLRYDLPQSRTAVFVYQDPKTEISEITPHYRMGFKQVMIQKIRGYTVARWRSSGLVYSLVTDMPPNEISGLIQNQNH